MTDANEKAARPLRVGLLLDGMTTADWVARLIEEMRAAPEVELVLAVMNGAGDDVAPAGPPPKRTPFARAARLWANRRVLPYTLHMKLDQRRYGRPTDPDAPRDVSALIADLPTIRVTPRMTKFCDYFGDADVAAIRAHDVDVLLRFGFRILKGDSLRTARYGVWSFHHGDNRVFRGGPPGYWEVADAIPESGAMLQVLTEDLDAGVVLARSRSSTNTISVATNKANFYRQAALLLLPALRDVHRRGQAAIDDAERDSGGWTAYSERLYVAPGPGETLGIMWRIAKRLVQRWFRTRGHREQWFLGYRFAPAGHPADVPDGTLFRYKELIPPRDRFWADPIPVQDGDRYWVFYEEAPNDRPNAHINVVELTRDGAVGEHRRALERPYHLSYPFVFRWNDAWWMIPETVANRAVELYRATSFPTGWELDRTLLANVDAVDATVLEIDGRWWMFTGMIAPGATEATALHLYHAETPLGPWTPHARNPVKVDVRGARPAGPLFRKDGALYRPGQDGAPEYGAGTIVFRVDELTPTTFRETEVARITPRWRPGLTGTHTLAAAGALTLIDARHRVPK